MKEQKKCEICGELYTPRNKRQKTCGSPACKRALYKQTQKLYEITHLKRNSERYKKIRIEAARKAKRHDSIVAEGYAERQIADSLRLAGRINTEL